MNLFVPQYIEKMLKQASYEYDKATDSWCAYVDALPGAYAQADTVEGVRSNLAEVIEDYILVSLYQKQTLPRFKAFATKASYAKAR
ncbi:MAG: hypothetical protein A3H59_01535 [Candidatus Jacksonbacteria bacterium RIFCSPLOWO2_02_FULL_43_9]|nr:MAG: hypothetical protein UV70_C0003G0008 [Parcubacteria group bacterium GW2011_GWA2_43_13]OGY69579.1 MAG: hypothetical protein A3B94_01910 [Candidatus Jacksonbacteria bacterium RIFCSPHIGHO2_02_FULL_43_10]OGY70541.1 MAG: hypothetical protein A2986_02385 [Candidatus Jacksonbacteria bacterium RIFCSPLOWO2_01_FULL_44_13]OGY72018.1 MAG: hypothetical protein A3H59_01535 [Candidatus Jacksonbacteria bacterium RIFCSPLOWO2_02_FULL_43_9]HAZ16314.1 hypothetical protein [Candidatus Jacksonbacteria bacter